MDVETDMDKDRDTDRPWTGDRDMVNEVMTILQTSHKKSVIYCTRVLAEIGTPLKIFAVSITGLNLRIFNAVPISATNFCAMPMAANGVIFSIIVPLEAFFTRNFFYLAAQRFF
jgi:hypothetical protein